MKRLTFGIILLLALWSSWWAWGQDQWISQRYFTTQTVWAVMLSMLVLFILGTQHRFATLIVSVTTFNMIITGLVYHLVLEVTQLHFQAHLSHTILPLAMLGVFFFFLENSFTYRQVWWLLVYPLGYLGFFIVFGGVLAWYPYPFMDVGTLGLGPVLRFSLGVLAPLFFVLALGLVFIKQRIHKKDHPKMV